VIPADENPDGDPAVDRTALRRVRELRAGPVPDPGELYWAGFAPRLRQRLPAPTRAWVPWTGMAAAACLLLLTWMGGRPALQSPTPADPDPGLAILDTWGPERVDSALDQVLGEADTDLLAAEIPELTLKDKRDLLESLREELSRTGTPVPPGLKPSPGPA